jgi:hypothetical protein
VRIEEALVAKLKATSGVTSLVSTRIYPVKAPQDTQASYIVYDLMGGTDEVVHSGMDGLRNARISFSCHGTTYAAAKAVAEAVRTALGGFNGTQSGLAVRIPVVMEDVDLYDDSLSLYLAVVDMEMYWSG